MDLFLEMNVLIWGYVIPQVILGRIVRFKKGGPYGGGGRYISNTWALLLLLGVLAISHFILVPIIRDRIEFMCSSDPRWNIILLIVGVFVMLYLIKSSRRKS